MKIAIYGKKFDTSFFVYIKELFDTLAQKKQEIVIFEPFYEYIKKEHNYIPNVSSFFKTHEDFNIIPDFFFSIGGDGTFLESINYVRNKNIPIVGFNCGRLGFLADISKDEISIALDAIFNGDYSLEQRTLLKLETEDNIFGSMNFALNELTIHKRDSSSMITIHTYLDNKFLNTYWADGLIVATPTGSTAYSLSAGGPIVVPNSNNFIITPLAPHNLTIRPLVVADINKISLHVEGRDSNFLVSLDSNFKVCNNSIKLHVSKADFCINVLKLDGTDFFNILRKKFMWGMDKRN